ncbi:MAG: hypothetical protein QOK39_2621 [Acidimicrobiaceae bacterium]|nr:hypothetical protein [Acidimicrobiaceae bacterium]
MPRRVVVLAAVILVAAGCRTTPVESGATLGQPAAVVKGGSAGGGTSSSPQTLATVPGGGDNEVTLGATARSVESTATITGLRSAHFSGTPLLTATGEVTDHAGHVLGTGTLRADGGDVAVTAGDLQVTGLMRIQPGQVTATGGSVTVGVTGSGPATVAASRLTFQPPTPPPPAPAVPPPTPAGTPTTAPPATAAPVPPVAIAGPVTVRAASVGITGSSLRFVDAPADVAVSSPEADLSWAGSGAITTGHGPIQATYLGVRAQRLQATIHRTASEVDVAGNGLALQAYANGVPQFRVAARIDVLSSGATTGFLGHRHAFVWTPRNLDNITDMAILSIRPGNAAASGVHLGLHPMPPMFGGEPHAPVGGDTAGLAGGDGIDSLIARHGDDKRSIGYDAPPGVQMVLVVQGNFDPITVTFTSY